MLDVVGILLSGVMVLFIIIRAVQLDLTTPWFEAPQPEPPDATPTPKRAGWRPAPARPIGARTGPPRSRPEQTARPWTRRR